MTYIITETKTVASLQRLTSYYGSCSSGSGFGFCARNAKKLKTIAGVNKAISRNKVPNRTYEIIVIND